MHTALVQRLLRDRSAWELATRSEPVALNVLAPTPALSRSPATALRPSHA